VQKVLVVNCDPEGCRFDRVASDEFSNPIEQVFSIRGGSQDQGLKDADHFAGAEPEMEKDPADGDIVKALPAYGDRDWVPRGHPAVLPVLLEKVEVVPRNGKNEKAREPRLGSFGF